mgnify:CR=1 FL=1
MIERKRYDAIDGLRAFSAIGIVLMHVWPNGKYDIGGFVVNRLIQSFTNLVFLFMIISSFAMCCGYYEKVISNQISIENFYKNRYARIWPYFAFLCLLDLCISPSFNSLYEVFANLTLCFGLLPNANIEVIGVGWYLGLIFVFYLIFPFFCFLLADKRRAWLALVVAFAFNLLCGIYFIEAGRTNIVYSMVYLMAGGLIFLYRDELSELADRYRCFVLVLCLVAALVYFFMTETLTMLILFSLLLIYSIGVKNEGVLLNPITKFLSGISMEIYLCHMVVYRVIEKLRLTHMFASDVISYIIAAIGTIIGAVFFAKVTQWLLAQGHTVIKKKVMTENSQRR